MKAALAILFVLAAAALVWYLATAPWVWEGCTLKGC